MSDFLLIVPAGWSEFDDINALINEGVFIPSEAYLSITSEDWGTFDAMLLAANHPVDNKLTKAAKLFQAETGFRLWLRLE